jgi:general nucleoside transport system permease protein
MTLTAVTGTYQKSWGMRLFFWAFLGVAMLSIIRIVTGADDLTSSGAVGASLRFAAPILVAGLGGLWAERAGIINIGLEGMMIAGTWFGAWVGFQTTPWLGVIAGVIAGAGLGAVHAFLTITVGIDQAVSGLSLNLLALGVTRFLSSIAFADKTSISQSPQLDTIPTVSLPGAEAVLRPLEELRWIFVSDVAAIARGLLVDISPVTVLCLAMVPFTAWILWRTRFGLRLRFCGENPVAAESLGINVYRMRYAAVTMSGALAGMGGAYLVTVASSIYKEGQTAGRGFIGLATVIFGNWRPSGVAMGSLLFGFTDALRVRQDETVHALLLGLAMTLGLLVLFWLRRRQWRSAILAAGIASAATAVFLATTSIPDEFVTFAPQLVTLLVLGFASQRLRPPGAAGAPYRRGESH